MSTSGVPVRVSRVGSGCVHLDLLTHQDATLVGAYHACVSFVDET
jgi:hypothetical protein